MEPRLTQADKIKIKMFYKSVWEKAGTDEFKQSLKIAKKAIAEYKEFGFNGIQDEAVRAMLIQIINEKK